MQLRQSQVRDHLRVVDGQQPVDTLDLDDERIFDDQVEPVAAFELRPLVLERHGSLAFEPKPEHPELVGDTVLVRRLEQPGPQVSMHLDAGADHCL